MKWLNQVFNFEELQCYELGEYVLCIHPNNSRWFRISKKLSDKLRKYDGYTLFQIYEQIKNKDLISNNKLIELLKSIADGQIRSDGSLYGNKTLFFVITTRCNLKCKTCYINASANSDYYEMNLEEIEEAFQKASSAGFSNIVLSGGEPFIRKDINQIILLAKRYFENITINSNGILIDEEIIKFIKVNDIKTIISLESIESFVNDSIRGKGTYEKIIKTIGLFKELDYKNVSVSMTVTQINQRDISCLYDMCREQGISIYLGIFIESGRGGCNRDYLAIETEEMMQCYIDLLSCELRDREPTYNLPSLFNKCSKSCGSLQGIINLMPDGTIYPCPNLIEDKWKIGNILENSISELTNSKVADYLFSRDVDCVMGCKDCPVRLICCGGCMANAYLKNGNIFTKDPLCKFYKQLYTTYLKVWNVEKSDIENTEEVIKECKQNLILG